MEKQFTVSDILSAKELYFYNQEILYIVDETDEAYGFHKDGSEWFHKENFWDFFDSSMMLSYFSTVTKEEAAKMYQEWTA